LSGDKQRARECYLKALEAEKAFCGPSSEQNSEYIVLYCRYAIREIDAMQGDAEAEKDRSDIHRKLLRLRATDSVRRWLPPPALPRS